MLEEMMMQRSASLRLARRAMIGCAAGLLATGALAESDPAPPTKGEAKLASLLEGRVAGAPVRCISSRPHKRIQMIDGTAYVFGQGATIWVQRTTRPQDIDRRNALINRRFSGGELCASDVVSTLDPIQGFFTGGVILTDFIPYTRVARTAAAPGGGGQ